MTIASCQRRFCNVPLIRSGDCTGNEVNGVSNIWMGTSATGGVIDFMVVRTENRVGLDEISMVGVGVTGAFVIGTDAADLYAAKHPSSISYSQKSSVGIATFDIDFGLLEDESKRNVAEAAQECLFAVLLNPYPTLSSVST
jgi:hypothetical protein